jgi:hypothetical protein
MVRDYSEYEIQIVRRDSGTEIGTVPVSDDVLKTITDVYAVVNGYIDNEGEAAHERVLSCNA